VHRCRMELKEATVGQRGGWRSLRLMDRGAAVGVSIARGGN
jgi:hypothetical protein